MNARAEERLANGVLGGVAVVAWIFGVALATGWHIVLAGVFPPYAWAILVMRMVEAAGFNRYTP